jgi:type II secretory pathway pseudopilin PulG
MKNSKAFTLIEIMVIIAIIGLLSAIIMVALGNARKSGNDSNIQRLLGQMRTQLELGRSGNNFIDLVGLGSNIATTTGASVTAVNARSLACDIGKNNGYVTQSSNLLLDCGGTARNTGVVIYTYSGSGSTPSEFALYARTNANNGLGYYCLDNGGKYSKGNTWPTLTSGAGSTFLIDTAAQRANCI